MLMSRKQHTSGSSSYSTANPTMHSQSISTRGQINAAQLQVGQYVWVQDPHVLWRVGEVQTISQEQQTASVAIPSITTEVTKVVDSYVLNNAENVFPPRTIPFSQLYTFDASHAINHNDIAQMNNMHEAPLLSVLHRRFEQDQIYTFTADILLSINPYKSIPLLYDVMSFMEKNKSITTNETKIPHVFTLAERAYNGMKGACENKSKIGIHNGTPQSIIISGESGAGKTEASKFVMKYLATASKLTPITSNESSDPIADECARVMHEKIEECVVLSNLILEAFGNAKTSRNDNSSRFGKYIQIHYTLEGRMAGISIRHFLLETTRLVLPQQNERNYHIFYQLLTTVGASMKAPSTSNPLITKNDLEQLKLVDNPRDYKYLSHGDCISISGVDDAAEFQDLKSCLDKLGMDYSTFQQPLMELLALILHLGNLEFTENAISNNDDDLTKVIYPHNQLYGVTCDHLARLLGVNPTIFARKLVTQTTVTGRGSILVLKLTPVQAKQAIDAFCKYLYGAMFHYIIRSINAEAKRQTTALFGPPKNELRASSSTKTPNQSRKISSSIQSPAFIGILDIFGFEIMTTNSLEQLCINFTNEMLQQQFNKHVFVLEQERYAAEGICVDAIEFQDNQTTLDLIQKPPIGLLPLLEEQMLLKRKTTDAQLLTIYHRCHLGVHISYSKPRFDSPEFIISHYAGPVTYSIQDFLVKNTDHLHEDMVDLLQQSTQPLIKKMFESPTNSANGNEKGNSLKRGTTTHTSNSQSSALTGTTTMSSRFRSQLTELMDVLWQTSPNYIKCIKPNQLKFPGGFRSDLVRDQLIYSGVLEVVRIRQEGYPIRKSFADFYDALWPLTRTRHFEAQITSRGLKLQLKEKCQQIASVYLRDFQASTKEPFAIGSTDIFLRYGQFDNLQAAVLKIKQKSSILLQTIIGRGFATRQKFLKQKASTVKIQSIWRQYILLKRYTVLQKAVRKLQSWFCMLSVKFSYKLKISCQRLILCNVRRYLYLKKISKLQREMDAAYKLQRLIRQYLLRTKAERLQKAQERSAQILQKWGRMIPKRNTFLAKKASCQKIQAHIHGKKRRREYLMKKNAAIYIQKFARQFLIRKKFQCFKRRIIKFQSFYRSYISVKKYYKYRCAVVVLQSKHRQQVAICRSISRRAAIQKLQLIWKGWHTRWRYHRILLSINLLQRRLAVFSAQKLLRRKKCATRLIQKVFRSFKRRLNWNIQVATLFANISETGYLDASKQQSSHVALIGTPQHLKTIDSERRLASLRANYQLFASLQPKQYNYNNLLHQVAAFGDFSVAKYLLTREKLGASNLLISKNVIGYLPLHVALAHGQYAMAKYIVHHMEHILQAKEADADNSDMNSLNGLSDDCLSWKNYKEINGNPAQEVADDCIIYAGYLRKRRETSRWMRRFVVISTTSAGPVLKYYINDKQVLESLPAAKVLDLSIAIFKKSSTVPFTFEIHSPELLTGRNKEGRLYFAAESELDIQVWLGHLRNTLPSSIETRLFNMNRTCVGYANTTKPRKKNAKAFEVAIDFIDIKARRTIVNQEIHCGGKHTTPLHIAASVRIGNASRSQRRHLMLSSSGANESRMIHISSSAISVTLEEPEDIGLEDNNIPEGDLNDSKEGELNEISIGQSAKYLELEAEVLKTVLWLIEIGADINALNSDQETPLKKALDAGNFMVAKHLLDRGALVTNLSSTEMDELGRIKAILSKNAISSISSTSSSTFSSSSSLVSIEEIKLHSPSSGLITTSSIKRRLSFSRSNSIKRSPRHSISLTESNISQSNSTAPLFLLKNPGRVKNACYVSLFVELLGISTPQYLSKPRLVLSVVDTKLNLVEKKQQVSVQPFVCPSTSALVWQFTWHMQTPLENLPVGANAIVELTVEPTIDRFEDKKKVGGSGNNRRLSCTSYGIEAAPTCWTFLPIDQRTTTSKAFNVEMYKYPIDLTMKQKTERMDAFLLGEVWISHDLD